MLATLVALGYDRSLPFADGAVATASAPAPLPAPGPWLPEVDHARGVLNLGGLAIDLGGIGKGLAVRWAAEALAGRATTALVEAGGDLLALGPGPDGDGWLVGVDDPRDTGGRPSPPCSGSPTGPARRPRPRCAAGPRGVDRPTT